MSNRPLDTTLVDKAIKFAVDAHAGTERRGKGFPYVVHVLEAMEIVATLTNDPELLAAAALHDTVEDTDVTVDRIREEFGARIASLVDSETQEVPEGYNETNSWRARRIAGIKALESASLDSKIVAMGDKLSNMRAVARDYKALGESLWSRFHAPNGKLDYAWYYRSLSESLCELAGTDAFSEFCMLLRKTFGTPEAETVDMTQYKASGEGFTAVSYDSLDGRRMFKLYEDYMPLHVPYREYEISRSLIEMGLKTPLATRIVTDGKKYGVEFIRVTPKQSFSRAISNNPERLHELSVRFAKMCLKLHNTPCDTSLFESADRFFSEEVKKCRFVGEDVKARALALIDSIPAVTTCIHGDMHLGNVILKTDTDEAFWIDLADFRYGNPLFDHAMFYLVVYCGEKETAENLFHITKAQLEEAWLTFLREYYGPDADLQKINDSIAPYTAILMMRFCNRENRAIGNFVEFINKIFA